MRKLLSVLAALTLSAPALAVNIEPDRWKSLHSLGCMILQECTDGVTKITSMEEVEAYYPDEDYSIVRDEMNVLFSALDDSGVGVYIAEDKYFPVLNRGVYSTEKNNFYLNASYMNSWSDLLSVTRHEGWHAAQDCMAGSIYNTSIAVIHQDGYIPASYTMRADIAYQGGRAVPWEAEAMWASETAMVTAEALKVCAGEQKMWDVYSPTPLTRQWLVEEGYIK